jgi:hypothetical protein
MKKTNLCTSEFQRPHTLKKACLSEIMEEVQNHSMSDHIHHTISTKKILSEAHYVMVHFPSF